MKQRIIYHAKSIYDIPLSFYKEHGVYNVLFDFDNTIDSYKTDILPNKFLNLVKELNKNNIKVFVISNGAKNRIDSLFNNTGIKYAYKLMKPLKKRIDNFIKINDINLEKSLYVGDQIMTDYLLSKKLKVKFILSEPVSNDDQFTTKINRIFERLVLKSKNTMHKNYEQLYE